MTVGDDFFAGNLLAKVQAIPSLENAKLTLGGKAIDPALAKVPLPACWVLLESDHKDEAPLEHIPNAGVINAQPMQIVWSVIVFVPYTTDDDMLNVQLPLLRSVGKTIHGTEADETSDGLVRWMHLGMKKALVYPDRIAYQHFFLANYWQSPPLSS